MPVGPEVDLVLLVVGCSELFKVVVRFESFLMSSRRRSLVSYRMASVWFGPVGFPRLALRA